MTAQDHSQDLPFSQMKHPNDNRDEDIAEAHVGKRLLAALGMLGRKTGTMPLRNFTGIPLFTGEEVNAFLERYNSVADDFEVGPPERVRGLLYYVQERGTKNVLQYIKSLPEWHSKDWEGMQAALRGTFPDEAESKPTFTIDHLRQVIGKDRRIDTLKQLSDYYFEYKIVADYLLDIEDITNKEHGSLFFRGLPSHMRYSLEAKERLLATQNGRANGRTNLKLDKIYTDCQDILKNEGVYSDANSNVEKATVLPAAAVVTNTRNRMKPEDEDVAALVRALEQLRVDFASLKQTVQTKGPYNGNTYNNNSSNANSGTENRPNNSNRNWDNNRQRNNNYNNYNNYPGSGSNSIPVRRKCIYDGCDKQKGDCEALKEDIAKGIVKAEPGSGHLLYPNGDRVQFVAGSMMNIVRNKPIDSAGVTAQAQSIELRSYRPPTISAP